MARGKKRKAGRLLREKLRFFFGQRIPIGLRFEKWRERLAAPDDDLLDFAAAALASHGYDPDTYRDTVLPELPRLPVLVLLDSYGYRNLTRPAIMEVMNYVALRWADIEIAPRDCLNIDYDQQMKLAKEIWTYGDIETYLESKHKTKADIIAAHESGDDIFTLGAIAKDMQRIKSDK